ncbi:MAG: NAD(P)-dependent oxidoreductase, partial [Gemmatimonadota bacterium]|nr:NAD(P)-dependent oxidoreductase [Gemmatimonadota bacterium]
VHHQEADLREREQVFEVVRRIAPEGVLHLAAAGVSYGGEGFGEMLRTNVLGTENLLAAVDSLEGKPPMVMAGSGYEYVPQDRPIRETDPLGPTSEYGVAKAAASLCAALYARWIPVTLLRLFNVYGPGEKEPRLIPYIVRAALRGETVKLTAGEQIRDYVYVEEAAESFWRALNTSPEDATLRVLNVGMGAGVPLRGFVEQLVAVLARRGIHPRVVFGARSYRPDEPMVYAANTAQLRRTLGWSPSVSVREGLERTLDTLVCVDTQRHAPVS